MNLKSIRFIFGFAILLSTLATQAAAQGTADIVGRVVDTDGGIVAGATVTARDVATNIVRTTVTSSTGDYTFTKLPVDPYEVKTEISGFKTEIQHITLATGDWARIDMKLQLGAVTESIQISADAQQLQTDTANIASQIHNQVVENVPIAGRDIVNLEQLMPGAAEGAATTTISGNRPDDRRQTSAVAVMGMAENENRHMIDGVDNEERVMGGMGIKPSLEESGGGNPNYPCCTFRGSVVVYDAKSGKQIWKSYTIPEEAKPIKKTSVGTQLWGPAGAGVWSSPAIDLKRRAVYVATGNGYTEPAAEASDAVLAFNLDTGKRLWVKQVMAQDSYVRNCPGKYLPNVPTANKSETCPDDLEPDMDFGNAPILRALPDGRTLILIGQKDGHAWALDPDKQGAVVWEHQVGLGLDAGGGGMVWGSAADDKLAYFPLTRGGASGGLAALKLGTGEQAWRADPPVGSSAPATVIPGVIFSGASNGTMYAYSTVDGKVLWKFDTAKDFSTVNGVPAKGGNLGGSGPVVAGGMLFVPSGYADLFGGNARGNVLLAFSPN